MLIRLTDTDLYKIVCKQMNLPPETDIEVVCEIKGYLRSAKMHLSQAQQHIELPEEYSIQIHG